MAEWAKQALSRPIHLADEVTKACRQSDRIECEQDLKPRAEKLAVLLRQAARQTDLYERLAIRILVDTEHVLEKALQVAQRCSRQSSSFLSRLFPVQSANFKKLSSLLDNSLSDVSWLLRVSNPSNDDDGDFSCVGLPPIASNEPILCFIWEQVARLQFGPPETRPEAAAALSAHARNERYRRVIVEEGGAAPLLRLLKEGRPEGKENAVTTIALLSRDPESVEEMVKLGACSVLASVLKDGTMKVQTSVANAVAEFAIHFPKSQDVFLQHNTERLLVGHLAFETVEEHSKYSVHSVVPKASMHSVVQSTMHATRATSSFSSSSTTNPFLQQQQQGKGVVGGGGGGVGGGTRGREKEEPETKAEMKAAAATALGMLCRGNSAICKNVTESKAMLCFAVLLEKGRGDVRSSSALALMEIAKVAEKDSDLRHSAFKPTSPAAKAVVDQLLKVVERGVYDELLIPCVVSLGCLAKTFRASETRIIPPLVKLLDEREVEVMKEAVVALTKFTSEENYLCVQHSRAVIEAGGAKHLVQLVYFEEQEVKVPALVLLCCIAKAAPDSEELAEGNVLNVLEWASKQSNLAQDEALDQLLPETRSNLELYQSRVVNNATVINIGSNGGGGAAAAAYAF